MVRTLEMIENDLINAEEELNPLRDAFKKACNKVDVYRNELDKFKIDNGLYYPMSDLIQYAGFDVIDIKLVQRNIDGELVLKDMYCEGIFRVDDIGHLYFSSMESGVIYFDGILGKYIWLFHNFRTEIEYVGFLEICVDSDEE